MQVLENKIFRFFYEFIPFFLYINSAHLFYKFIFSLPHCCINFYESVQKVIFHRQEAELPHNPYDQEKRELDIMLTGPITSFFDSKSMDAYKTELYSQ